MLRLGTDLRGLGRDRAGAAGVEFGLLAPVLALLAVGAMDTGLLVVRSMEVRAAAQAGADYALANGWDAAGISAAVRDATRSPLSIQVTPAPALAERCVVGQAMAAAGPGGQCPSGAVAGRYVTVGAQAPYQPILPWPGMSGSRTLTAQAVVRIP